MSSAGETAFKAAFEISPIILQDGIAQYTGGYLPLTLITEIIDFPGLKSKEFFAHYKPVGGTTLAEWNIAEYPFVNLTMAANAQIQMPLKISMLMVAPAQNNGGMLFKQAIFTALKLAIEKHVQMGGSFIVLTPAYTYLNCLLVNLRDISPPSDKQVQTTWQWDFVQPLITESAAAQVYGQFVNGMASGVPTAITNSAVPVSQSLLPGETIVP